MDNPPIFINGIKEGEILDLSDNGETEVYSDGDEGERTVTWQLNCEEVLLFYVDSKKGHNPFKSPIPKKYATSVVLTVKKNHPKHLWEYAIVWLDRDNNKHRHDPKIAIRSSKDLPSHRLSFSWKTWVGLGLGLVGIALLLSDRKKKNR